MRSRENQIDKTTRRSVAALALVGLTAWAPVIAGPQDAATPAQQPVYAANVELVLIDVAVLGDGDVPIAGLAAEDFVIEEDGEERDVGLVMNAIGAPLDIALAIDLSGSMLETPWRERAADFLSALDPARDCVFLMGFSSGVGGSIWARPDHPALVESLELSRAQGGTALFDATVAAANELAAAAGTDLTGLLAAWESDLDDDRPGPLSPVRTGACPVAPDPTRSLDPTRRRRRALVMVTDGIDSGSRYREHHARLAAHAAGVAVFHVAVTPPSSRPGGRPPGARRSRSSGLDSLAAFARIVDETGGTRIRASATAYHELLNHLRGFYIVGYYVPRADPGTLAEIQRHQLRLRLRGVDGEVLYPRASYRPTIDRLRVQTEVAEARKQLEAGDLDAAQFAADNAVAADPVWGPSYAVRAEILERLERTDDASADALTAADLTPGDAATHQLAGRLAFAAGNTDIAWEQAIRAAQAGIDMNDMFDFLGRLARQEPIPEDFLRRLEAPRLALVVGPSRENDLFARAALGKAMLAVGRALSDAPFLALTRTQRDGDFVIRVSDKSVDNDPPRKFRGQITLMDPSGDEIYDKGFTLDALDDPARNATDLAKHIREIIEKVTRANLDATRSRPARHAR